jgi:hypothetical protein
MTNYARQIFNEYLDLFDKRYINIKKGKNGRKKIIWNTK